MNLPRKSADGFFHPGTEDEIIALVKQARADGVQIRVRGAAHSVSYAVYTNPAPGVPDVVLRETPPPGDDINVMLDRYRQIVSLDTTTRRVTAEAGIHLGVDPMDPVGTATLETSLLYQLQQKGFTFEDLGGITHQTIGGFLSTGSAGGSIKYGIEQNIVGLRIIDGTGTPFEVSASDPDPSLFRAALVSMGVLGVVSRVTFALTSTFDIRGEEAITTIDDAKVDLFGPGAPGRPSLQDFVTRTDYSRLFWWPQRGAERVVVWQASRIPATPDFVPKEYEEFGGVPLLEELLIAIFYTIIGNLDDLDVAKQRLEPAFARAKVIAAEQSAGWAPLSEDGISRLGQLIQAFVVDHPIIGEAIEKLADGFENVTLDVLRAVTMALIDILRPFASHVKNALPQIMRAVIPVFVPLDSEKFGADRNEPQYFQDHAYRGLPMDDQADDILVGTGFTEIWVPLGRTREVMCLFRDYFESAPSDAEALKRTGVYTWELYAAKPHPGWLSMSSTDGNDSWKDGAFRVDVFWYSTFAGDPVNDFYQQFWDLLKNANVPFRLHWGKYQPSKDPTEWAAWFRQQYPNWDRFLALRAEKDPHNLFLTKYWKDRLGL